MILGLRTVVYPVTDLADATAWYRRVLDVAPYFEEPFYVGFDVGGFELGLIPDGVPGATGGTAFWGTPDVVAEMHRLVGLGAKIEMAVTDVGGGVTIGSVKDPYGNVFGIVDNPQFDRAKVG